MIGNYAILVNIQDSYLEISGNDYIYDVGDVINIIYIDLDTANYPLIQGLSFEPITDSLNEAYVNTLAKISSD